MKLSDTDTYSDNNGSNSLTPFLLITACFILWGFANNVTTPLVGAYAKIFNISITKATLVPFVCSLGYFCLALPAAFFIQRFSLKWGLLTGLALYAVGALLFLPASAIGAFFPFLIAYFVLAGGLSFLETCCNPYVYCHGDRQTAIQRLNAAQSFNALGAVVGMFVAMFVHSQMSEADSLARSQMPVQQFNIIKDHDLDILIQPYFYVAAIVVLVLVTLWLSHLPHTDMPDSKKGPVEAITQLLTRKNYREGVIAEFCYIGAQAGCWMFISYYGTRIFVAEGMTEQAAEVTAQKYNILAMVFFACSRFVCTWLLRRFSPERMLTVAAILGMTALIGVILFTDRSGIYCLVAVSACLSLMFPTIYGLALRNIDEDVKTAGAGLVMAIIGGAVIPPLQAVILQSDVTLLGLPGTNLSYLIPFACLAMVAWYGHRAYVRHTIQGTEE